MEKVSLEHIRLLLEITEGERNHELLLYVKNLLELGPNPFPYIVPVIPCPLLVELVRGEHFILASLLKLIPCSSAQVRSAQEPQVETAKKTPATFILLDQSPLDEQDYRPTS